MRDPLTITELEELLCRQEPSDILREMPDRLDQTGRRFLAKRQKELDHLDRQLARTVDEYWMGQEPSVLPPNLEQFYNVYTRINVSDNFERRQ